MNDKLNANHAKTLADWLRVNIKINNIPLNKADLTDTNSIVNAVSQLKTNIVIQKYICRLAHQDGFLTAGKNQTAYSLLEQRGIQIILNNGCYEFTQQSDGSVQLKEQFDIEKYFNTTDPETTYAPKNGVIARVTTVTTIQLNPNNPEKLILHTLDSYQVDIIDSELGSRLFDISLLSSIRHTIALTLVYLSQLFRSSPSSSLNPGEWINPSDQSIEPTWAKPKGKY